MAFIPPQLACVVDVCVKRGYFCYCALLANIPERLDPPGVALPLAAMPLFMCGVRRVCLLGAYRLCTLCVCCCLIGVGAVHT